MNPEFNKPKKVIKPSLRHNILWKYRFGIKGVSSLPIFKGSGGGVVGKLLTCGARGPGFYSRSRRYDFRDWLSLASLFKATYQPTNPLPERMENNSKTMYMHFPINLLTLIHPTDGSALYANNIYTSVIFHICHFTVIMMLSQPHIF